MICNIVQKRRKNPPNFCYHNKMTKNRTKKIENERYYIIDKQKYL